MINPVPCFSRRISWKHRIHWRWLKVVSRSRKNMHALLTNMTQLQSNVCLILVLPSANIPPPPLISPDSNQLHDGHAWLDSNKGFCLVKFCGSRSVCAPEPSQLVHHAAEGQRIQPTQREWPQQLQPHEVKVTAADAHTQHIPLSCPCVRPQKQAGKCTLRTEDN